MWDQIFSSRMSRMTASEIRELLKLLDQPDIISFAGGIPDPKLFPVKTFQDAFAETLGPDTQDEALQYSASEGYPPLRDWIAGEMAKLGVACDRDNILITSGSQQALDYLGKLMLSPNDTALVSWPTYLGALGAFNAYEPHYDRLQPHSNRAAADYAEVASGKGGQVKFAYASVDFANPTGETIDRAGRESILDMADELNIAVIEDAAYQSLRYTGEAIPPMLALEIARKGHIDACRTIYCGSFSKTLSPGLRVGWVCAAKPVISRLVLMKQASDLHSPSINQIAIHKVAQACFGEHVEKLRKSYKTRLDHMLNALSQHMPEGVTWTNPEGGMFVWLTLPEHLDGAELLAESLRSQRVAFVPGRAFHADGSCGNTIRLNFSQQTEGTIDEGIRRLGQLLRG
ncbi:aminotransferase-like domain-containing protein [Loktanella sp. S4079]|uniref:aminotransferase-like domain-containing protein n=1 Tax=Loktanella sp. S4079 TaxID=579483 RepID=UPI0005F9BCEE|nr:PLP-dependent aminotransferase family protein [Loktanella sp. S4079]KJZ18925.1 GntR family transcriptional regulator [Loktanella sp. S4079]